jgi:DNA polymerase I
VEFHEEDFKMKDWNKEKLKEVFTELEFKTLGKRILGEEVTASGKTAPEGVQIDLFGNIVEPEGQKSEVKGQKKAEDAVGEEGSESLTVEKNINNTPHKYEAIEGDEAIGKLIDELKNHTEICFDTETTGIDANDAELVGLSFSVIPGEAFYVPVPANQEKTRTILSNFTS